MSHKSLHTGHYTFGIFLSVPIIHDFINEYNKTSPNTVLSSSANFDEALEQARIWEEQGVDVFISRRGTGDLLRKNCSTPVLILPRPGLDITDSIRHACPKGSRVLVPAFLEPYADLEQMEELIDIPILQQVYTDFHELEALVRRSAKLGIDFVAGGNATKRLAQKYGIPFVFLAPSREQFFSIVESAQNVAKFNHEKESMIAEMQGIMDSMNDAFLSVAPNGTILGCNSQALRLWGIRKRSQFINTSIFPYIPHKIFDALMSESGTHDERVIDIKDTQLIMSTRFIMRNSKISRILMTLRKTHDIIRQSGSIRSAISRGFETHYRLRDMVHKSPIIRQILELCKTYAKIDSSVLIYGETGTGKEILAQGIHNQSKRRKNPFVSINCAELPEPLLESELFGYDEGAFTGSRKGGKAGFFELAHGGTILLDEIDSASPLVQSKLLRVLQEKEIMHIGGKRKIPVDVRVIATSGRDLWEQVCLSAFRKDLFFRLHVLSLSIPPLRERTEDIENLLPHFISHHIQHTDIKVKNLSKEQVKLLQSYAWPGNVRQLQHFAERFVLFSSFMDDPFTHLYNELHNISYYAQAHSVPSQAHHPLGQDMYATKSLLHNPYALPQDPLPHPSYNFATTSGTTADFSEMSLNNKKALDDPQMLQLALKQAQYSKKKAAEFLGVSRSTLWRKLRQYNIA